MVDAFIVTAGTWLRAGQKTGFGMRAASAWDGGAMCHYGVVQVPRASGMAGVGSSLCLLSMPAVLRKSVLLVCSTSATSRAAG